MYPTRGKAATSSLTDPTKDTTPHTDKKSAIVTTSMKREKLAGLRSNDKIVKPSKKLKVRIISDDQSPSEAGQSKEANNTPVYPSGRVTRAKVGGKTSEATKSISNGKKTPGKREKAAELKSPVIKSTRKKGEISADNKGQKILPEGAEGDSTKTTTPDIAEEGVTLLMHLSGEYEPLNPEAVTPQSFAPLPPETTGNQNTQMVAQQPLPMLTKENTFPQDYDVEIGKNNARVEFHKINCAEPSCQIAIEVLKLHKCRSMLDKSASIPEFYVHQMWHTIKLDMGEDSFTCTLDRKKVTVDVNYLRKTLLLPEAPAPTKKFHPTPSEEVVLNFLLEIGFDIQPNKPLKSVSKVEAKLIPQPWRTIYYILARSISGRDCGHEHPRLPHLQIFWGIVNQKQIDYAQLIWDDIVFQIQRHYLKPFTKIPFVRYTKLLIYHLLDDNEDIPRRLEDPEKHLFAMDKTVNQVYMPKGSTHKQGMRLPDSLLTDKIKKTQTYLKYDKAFKEGYVGFSKYDDESTPAKLRKVSKAKKGKKTKDVPMDEDEEIDWDAATDEGMEHVIKENIERGEKERFSENKGGTSMTSLGNEERNSEDNEGMDDDDDRSYRWVRRNEKKRTPDPTPRKSTRTTSREPVVTVSVHEQPPTPEPTTQELDETSFVTVAQMKTVMSTAIAHVNEQIEKAVADQFKKYLASQPTTSQPTTSSTQHPNTSGPQHNYRDFEFEELKQMMLARMLDQPELRNAKPALFGYLYRGADLERTCTTNVLRKRLHDDPDSDNH